MSVRRIAWPLVALASAAVTLALVAADVESPARTLMATWFLLVCPGLALTWMLARGDLAALLVLALPTSVALDLAVTGGLLGVDRWSPDAAVYILTGLTAVAAAVTAWRASARPAP